MPNHIHLLWEMHALNGNERPYASFLKYRAHEFGKHQKSTDLTLLEKFSVEEKKRKHRSWQPDPLAINILSKEMMEQKLEYCHNNPMQENWKLAASPEDYFY